MKKLSLALLTLALALLTALPALAAEEDAAQPENAPVVYECVQQAELFQFGSLSGAYTAGDAVECLSGEQTLAQVIAEALKDKAASVDISSFGLIAEVKTGINEEGEEYSFWAGEGLDQLRTAYETACNDHPEYIYAPRSYGMSGTDAGNNKINITTLVLEYDAFYTEDVLAQFDAKVDEALACVSGVNDPLEQTLILHDWLVSHVVYNWDVATTGKTTNSRVYSAYGALVDGDAVCQGYALAYKLLLNKLGIGCTTISSDTMNHMWNAVQMDGTWYHVDVTWDDPTPNVQGGGSHTYFLRGDTWMQSNEGNHPTWNEGQTACSNDDYQPDWWLNAVWFPIYRWEESYYYVNISGSSFNYSVYCTTTLLDAGSSVTSDHLDNSFSSQNGVVWVDGQLYYTKSGSDDHRTLTRVDLATGGSAEVGNIEFIKAVSADKHYDASRDGVGLWYDEENGVIRATSNTRPSLRLGSFPVRSYPPAWDALDKSAEAVAARWRDDVTLQVGMVLPDDTGSVALWVAFYDGSGKMAGLRQVNVTEAEPGLTVWTVENCPQTESCGAFLLDGSALAPLCAAAAPSP